MNGAGMPEYLDPGEISGHPGLNWYTKVTKTAGRDLQAGQWLDSLDHSGARTIHSITPVTGNPDLLTVAFSDIDGDCEQVRVDVEYDVVDPRSHVGPDGTPVGFGCRPSGGGDPSVCVRCESAPSRSPGGCCVTCQMAEVMNVPVEDLLDMFGDEQAWRQVQADADQDPILASVLDAAEMEERAEFADRMLLNAEQSGPVTQPTMRRRPAWLRRVVLITAMAGFLAVFTILAANSAA